MLIIEIEYDEIGKYYQKYQYLHDKERSNLQEYRKLSLQLAFRAKINNTLPRELIRMIWRFI
jgi:hypothetical protein